MANKTRTEILAEIDTTLVPKVRVANHKTLEQNIANSFYNKESDGVIAGETLYGGTIVTNLNTIAKSGFYSCSGTASGVPSTDYSWYTLHQNSNVEDDGCATQRAVAYNNGELVVFERVKTSDIWGNWIQNLNFVNTDTTLTGLGNLDSPLSVASVQEYDFSQLLSMANNNELRVGFNYILTDYECYSTQAEWVSPTEKLLLTAISTNKFSINATSLSHPTDIIYYDFAQNYIPKSYFAEYSDGTSVTDVHVTILDANRFSLDKGVVIDPNFYIDVSDSVNSASYNSSNVGSTVQVEVSNGTSIITLDNVINLLDTECYIGVDASFVDKLIKGTILRRCDPIKKICRNIDYRNARVRKYLKQIDTYSASTAYANNQLINYDNSLYISSIPFWITSIENETPGASKYWVSVPINPTRMYTETSGTTYLDLPLFCLIAWDTMTITYNDDNITALDMSQCIDDKNVFANCFIRNCKIASNSLFTEGSITNSTIEKDSMIYTNGNINESIIGYNNNIVVNSLEHSNIGDYNYIYCGYMSLANIGSLNNFIKSNTIMNSKFGSNNNYISSYQGGSILNSNFGSNNTSISFKEIVNSTIGNNNIGLASLAGDLNNVSIENMNQYIEFIEGSTQSKMGTYNRGSSTQRSSIKLSDSTLGNNSYKFYLKLESSTLNTFVDGNYKPLFLVNSTFDAWSGNTTFTYPVDNSPYIKNTKGLITLDGKAITLTNEADGNTPKEWNIRSDGVVTESYYDNTNTRIFTNLTA